MPKSDADRFHNALRIMMSLDEVIGVLGPEEAGKFHNDPFRYAIRMDRDKWEKVYALIEARQ